MVCRVSGAQAEGRAFHRFTSGAFALAARNAGASIGQAGDGNDFHGAIQFLLERFQDRDEASDEELVVALLGVAERTRSRSIAFGALNFLVETWAISDLEALDRIEAWDDRNEGKDRASR